MKLGPGLGCERVAEMLRVIANELPHGEIRAEYEYMVRGYLRLAKQFEPEHGNQYQDLIGKRRLRGLQ